MGDNNQITTYFGADISELRKAMQDAKKAVAVANSEFELAAAACDDWSKESSGLSAKLKQLNSVLDAQKKMASSLEEQYRQVCEEQGETSKGAQDLLIKINYQKAAINKTQREISNFENSLKEVTEAEKISAKTGKDVSEVLDEMGNEAKDTGDGFTTLKGTIATFAGNMLTNLVGSIKNGISSIMGLADETREYRSELAKLETAFTTAGHTTETATKTYKDLYTVLGDEGQATEAANHLAKLCNTEEDLAKWTDIAAGVYGTFGDSLPIEGLTEAANETAKTGAITGALSDAVQWAGLTESEFQESLDGCSSEQERQSLITKTLNGLYSDAAKKYKETNKSVMDANKANSDYTDTLATMGEKIEPVTTTLKQGFNGLLQELLKLVGDVDMAAFTAKIEEGFAVLKDQVLPAIKEGLGWILDNKDTIIASLAGIAAGFVAFKIATVIASAVAWVKKFTAAIAAGKTVMQALNLTMKMNVIGLVVAAIAGLVAAFVVLWKKSDTFRNFWIGLWDKIKETCSVAKEWLGVQINEIGNFFTKTLPNAFKIAIDWIKTNWTTILTFLTNPFAGLFKYFYQNNGKFKEFVDTAVKYIKELPGKVWTWLVNTINKVNTWRKNMIDKAKDTALNFINKVIDYVKQLPDKVWTWLVNVISKVSSWASDLANKGKEAATNFINRVVDYIRELPGKIGTWLSNAISTVVSWGSDLANKGKEAANDLIAAIVNKVQEIPGKLWSIGEDIIKGLWNGMNDTVSWLKGKISGFVGNVTDWLKDFFGIGSPSKLMANEVGKWLPEGIAVGVDKNSKGLLNSMQNLAVNTVGAARNGLSTASSSIGGTVGARGGIVNNFTQVINSPKQLSRLDIYRQSKNLLGYVGGGA